MNIIERCNNIHLNTQHRIIGLYNVVIKVFRFKTTLGKITGLERFVKNRFINFYNNDDNLCIFACLAYYLNSSEYLGKKGDIKGIHTISVKLDKKFSGNDFDYTQYKGFDTVNETQDLCNI
jgi:hypothetical protein